MMRVCADVWAWVLSEIGFFGGSSEGRFSRSLGEVSEKKPRPRTLSPSQTTMELRSGNRGRGGERDECGEDERPKGTRDTRGGHRDGTDPAIVDLGKKGSEGKFSAKRTSKVKLSKLQAEEHFLFRSVTPSPFGPNRPLERTHQDGALAQCAVTAPPVTRYRGTMPGRVANSEGPATPLTRYALAKNISLHPLTCSRHVRRLASTLGPLPDDLSDYIPPAVALATRQAFSPERRAIRRASLPPRRG